MKKFKKSFIIVSHTLVGGSAQNLFKFLRNKSKQVAFVGHPLNYAKNVRDFYELYENGKLTKKREFFSFRFPEILSYLKDFFSTFFITSFFLRKKFNVYIGCDALNAFSGLILKKLGIVKEVMFYTIDYFPQRFNNSLLNKLYHF